MDLDTSPDKEIKVEAVEAAIAAESELTELERLKEEEKIVQREIEEAERLADLKKRRDTLKIKIEAAKAQQKRI